MAMKDLDCPGNRFHWCWAAWFPGPYWRLRPAIIDDFGNLVLLDAGKGLFFITGWTTGTRTRFSFPY